MTALAKLPPRSDLVRQDQLAVLNWTAVEHADLVASCAISAREAAMRGWVEGARHHALQARLALVELLATTREAVELSEGAE